MIVAEIKNKYNSMNSSNKRQVVDDMDVALRQKRGDWTGYLAHIVPQSPRRYTKHLKGNLFATDGTSFYHNVTGDPNAVHNLLPLEHQSAGSNSDLRWKHGHSRSA